MKFAMLAALLFIINLAHGQFAFVSDKDGFVNVRSKAGAGNSISDTLRNSHLVYCFQTENNWSNIQYTKQKKECSGFIYHDRIKLVSGFENIPILTQDSNITICGKDSIKIIVSEKKFNRSRYRFTYYKGAGNQIHLINGRQYWGTDGEVPKTEYKSILIQIGNKKIYLPPSALENLFEPNIQSTVVNYDRQHNILFIQSSNGDGAGYYEVIWRVENGIYRDRYIAYGF